MPTINEVGRQLRRGTIDPGQALALFQADQVTVYPVVDHGAKKTWQSVEEASDGMTLYADLRNANATAEQMALIAREVDRARSEGRTIPPLFSDG